MRKTNKSKPGKSKERAKRPSVQRAGVVELPEQDLKHTQGGQNSTVYANVKIDF